VEVRCDEAVATRISPEPCVVGCEGALPAFTVTPRNPVAQLDALEASPIGDAPGGAPASARSPIPIAFLIAPPK
jgi:hypothetical protein